MFARAGIERRRRGSFDPDVAPVEVFVLPDRHDLLDPFNRVAARRERRGAMRRRGRNGHADFTDFETADAVMARQPRPGPALGGFLAAAVKSLIRESSLNLIFHTLLVQKTVYCRLQEECLPTHLLIQVKKCNIHLWKLCRS